MSLEQNAIHMSILAIKQFQSEVEKIIHFGGTKKRKYLKLMIGKMKMERPLQNIYLIRNC